MAEKLRTQLETEVLPRFIAAQRWYAAKGEPIKRARSCGSRDLGRGRHQLALVFRSRSRDSLYFLPLALGWEEDEDHVRALAAVTVARVRQQANVGVLADAIADEGFCRHVVKAIGAGRSLPTANGSLRFTRTRAYAGARAARRSPRCSSGRCTRRAPIPRCSSAIACSSSATGGCAPA